jgi:hypothetical protein
MAVERGPNLNLLDQVEPIRDSPLFNSWRNPIPPEWFTINKRAYTLVDQEALYGSLQFSTFYGRTATVTISAPTITAVLAQMGFLRGAVNALGVPSDSIVTTRTFYRSAAHTIDPPQDVAFVLRNSGSLINPMIDTYP